MHVKQIRLINFKNYQDQHFQFSPGINCIVGPNGSGKTNLLDALYYLSMTKSAFNSTDAQNIRNGEPFFSLLGDIDLQGKSHSLFCSLEKGKKKVFKLGENEYEKLSEHIGKFPCVLIAPNDIDLIREASEIRRKYFDSIISQIDQAYLRDLIRYNHNLKQRNHLLRLFRNHLEMDKDLLDSYDKVLLEIGFRLYEIRKSFSQDFIPSFIEKYASLADEKEQVSVKYESQFESDNYTDLLQESLSKDIELQRTTFGAHKDKWTFEIGGRTLKRFGSQGQQKTFIIGLKLSQFDFLNEFKGFRPVLLLDDVFDKLDDNRIEHLMDMIANKKFSQIFLTDARPERTKTILSSLNLKSNVISIEQGKVS